MVEGVPCPQEAPGFTEQDREQPQLYKVPCRAWGGHDELQGREESGRTSWRRRRQGGGRPGEVGGAHQVGTKWKSHSDKGKSTSEDHSDPGNCKRLADVM